MWEKDITLLEHAPFMIISKHLCQQPFLIENLKFEFARIAMFKFITCLKFADERSNRVDVAVDFLLNLAKAVITLFIIVDPFGNIPIFIALTRGLAKDERQKAFRTAISTGFVLLLSFALVGQQILTLFGISIYSFMIAGGILLLMISIRILLRGEWEERPTSPESIGVVPIGFPLLVGPGAITTTIINLQTYDVVITIISVLIVFILTQIILSFINPIYNFLGNSGSTVIARLMALLIAAIAVQFIVDGFFWYSKNL